MALLRVVKLGGSLLDLPNLRERFGEWLTLQQKAKTALIVGGGALVDAIRELDRVHRMNDDEAHWHCVRAMGVSAEVAASILRLPVCREPLGLADRDRLQAACVFDVTRFLCEEEPRQPGAQLPYTWDATSDSIAARVAEVFGAAELVLLKSILPREAVDIESAVAARLVDRRFPRAAAALPCVRVVNFRAAHFNEASWLATSH